jgi:Icc-related predicted phosphoesterase
VKPARNGVCARAIACVILMVLARSVTAGESSAQDAFAFLGDPQIGYGQGGSGADAARFRLAVDAIAASGLGLTVIAGDLVQDRSLWQRWAYERVARRLPGLVLVVPGNHDIVDVASLAAWRNRYGPDYREVLWHDIAFILLDSETLRDGSISAQENADQWAFLERALTAHTAAGRSGIVLVMHRPPFVSSEDEAEEGANWPPAARARLLSLARAHGVRLILSGHLHRTARIATADGIEIIVSAGSARSFDQSPVGFHRIVAGPGPSSVEQVVVAPPPREPVSVPGIPEWTPRLFDFSVRHWLFTVFYGVAGALAFAARRRSPSSLWTAVGMLMFFFAVNMQLDFDEFLRVALSVAAKATGLYGVRHRITGSVLVLGGIIATVLWLRGWRTTHKRLPLLALGLVAPSSLWFCLSVISHHDWGMLFAEQWWDLLILATLVGIATCSLRSR